MIAVKKHGYVSRLKKLSCYFITKICFTLDNRLGYNPFDLEEVVIGTKAEQEVKGAIIL